MKTENNETKVCKHCQSEIPKKAKVCPICRKKQGGKMKFFVIAIIAIIIIAAISGGGDENDDGKASDSNPKKVDTVESSEKKEDEGNGTNTFSVGDVVETSNLKVTFVSAEEYKSDNEFVQPKSGNVYFKMDFEFENISDSDSGVSSYDFKCYADGYDMEQAWMDGFDLDATLSPGKKTKGAVFFEMPKESKEITLEYETNFWTENKIVFKVK